MWNNPARPHSDPYHQIRFTSQKIARYLELIEPLVYRRCLPLIPFRYRKLDGPEVSLPDSNNADDWEWVEVPYDSYWGEPNVEFILMSQFQVPQDWGETHQVALYLPIGTAGDFSHPEASVYIDDVQLAACDRHHQEILLPDHLCDGEEHVLTLVGWTGLLGGGREIALRMGTPQLVQVYQPVRDFIALARVALGIADNLDDGNPTLAHLYNALDESFKLLDIRQPIEGNFYDSIKNAANTLQQGVEVGGLPLDIDVTAIGHAHIDIAWLWPLMQARLKAGRTFHNVLRLMDQFPGYTFVQSQAQLYDYVRQDYPDLFQEISRKIEQGRWEAIGGMWVEADCNLSGGEAMARQFLLGHNFFEDHFGEDSYTPVLWLPDVFGFPWSIPQLAREAGLKYFFSIKLGWSQYNRIPYDSFWWQGIDGTRLLAHFSTTIEKGATMGSTYNAGATPYEALSTWRRLQQKDWGASGSVPPLLMVFGHGDGGGGPTREMLENINLMSIFPSTPRVHHGKVSEFYEKLEEIGERLPVWNGELYLEYHRGTYTTQARNKRANRKGEFLLHDAEFLASYAAAIDLDYLYPHEELQSAWQLLCLNQFHDILPGSSIGEVYRESLEQYDEVFDIGSAVCQGAFSSISRYIGGEILIVNPTSFDRDDLAVLDAPLKKDLSLLHADGSPVAVQSFDGGTLLDLGITNAYSITPLFFSDDLPDQELEEQQLGPVSVSEMHLENQYLRVDLNENGEIRRLFDKVHQREVLPEGAVANQFQAFEDRPRTPDAWEIDIYYDDKMWLADPAESIRVVESGPLRVVVEVRRRILKSSIVQRIILAYNSRRLDLDTHIDWREQHILLKAAFPVEVLAPNATYEIPWGHVERPTHTNTSWDWAMFEVPAYKWIDLSEGGYGVSLLNDCKYGCDVHENVMRITLLRGSTYPDPDADLGKHDFVYSIMPHEGNSLGETICQAYALNDPLLVHQISFESRGDFESQSSFIRTDLPNVIVETIKAAEDGRGLIARLYESQGIRGFCYLTTSFSLQEVWKTNLLEADQQRIAFHDRRIGFDIKPFQIITLRLI